MTWFVIHTFLLLIAAFIIGWIIGWLLRSWKATQQTNSTEAVSPSVIAPVKTSPANTQEGKPKSQPAAAEKAPESTKASPTVAAPPDKTSEKQKPKAAAVKPKTTTATKPKAAAKKAETKPSESVDSADAAGKKPRGLKQARKAGADDLKRIRGIGPQNEKKLNELGIFHFDQISKWTPENAVWVGSFLAFPGRIEREEWVEQAATLAEGGDTDFSKRVDKGRVRTSKF